MNKDSTSETKPLPIMTTPDTAEQYNEAVRHAKLTNQPIEHFNNLKDYYDNLHESNRYKRKINKLGKIIHLR